MKKGELIFVYGTLRRGERADLSKGQHNFGVTFLGDDLVSGKLYHLGGYPGVKDVPDAFDWDASYHVVGEIFLIREQAIVSIMDAYEGYDDEVPERGLYNRKQTVTADGRTVWIYTYNGRVTPDQLIETGDWKNPRLTCHRVLQQRGDSRVG